MIGWLENQSQFAFVFQLFGANASLRCKISTLSETGAELSTNDGGRLSIDLVDSGMVFQYAEPREFPEIEASGITVAQAFASSLAAVLPLRPRLDGSTETKALEAESWHLAELIE